MFWQTSCVKRHLFAGAIKVEQETTRCPHLCNISSDIMEPPKVQQMFHNHSRWLTVHQPNNQPKKRCIFLFRNFHQILRDHRRYQNVCFFIVFYKPGGGVKPIYKKIGATFVLFCGPPENRPKDNGKPPKTAENRPKDDWKWYKLL